MAKQVDPNMQQVPMGYPVAGAPPPQYGAPPPGQQYAPPPMMQQPDYNPEAKKDYDDLCALGKRDTACSVLCPFCGFRGNTDVTRQTSVMQYVVMIILVWLGCTLCFCIPLCISSM